MRAEAQPLLEGEFFDERHEVRDDRVHVRACEGAAFALVFAARESEQELRDARHAIHLLEIAFRDFHEFLFCRRFIEKHHLGLHLHHGKRRAEFVRDVRDEPFLPFHRAADGEEREAREDIGRDDHEYEDPDPHGETHFVQFGVYALRDEIRGVHLVDLRRAFQEIRHDREDRLDDREDVAVDEVSADEKDQHAHQKIERDDF